MAGKGPPKTPTAILRARGSRLLYDRVDEPTPPTGRIYKPSWLSETASKYWDETKQILRQMQVLSVADVFGHALLVEAIANYVATKSIYDQTGGKPVYMRDNEMRKNLAYQPMMQAWDQALRACREFGLTPSSRASLSITPPNDEKIVDAEVKDKGRFFND